MSKPAAAKGDKEVAEEPLTESEKLMRREKTGESFAVVIPQVDR